MSKGVHSGHRERLRNRFMQTNAVGFQEHELLELLLFYALPRVNTNEISHTLIEKFGSLSAVLDAKAEEIADVKGLSMQSAMLIKLMSDLCRRYAFSVHTATRFSASDQVVSFLSEYFSDVDSEICLLISINAHMELKGVFSFPANRMKNGGITSRELAETVLGNKITRIIIGQNRISGVPLPSESDYGITKMLSETLVPLGVEIYDHIICGKEGFCSMRKSGGFSFEGEVRRKW